MYEVRVKVMTSLALDGGSLLTGMDARYTELLQTDGCVDLQKGALPINHAASYLNDNLHSGYGDVAAPYI